MAWQFPQSVTQPDTVAFLDEVGESVFIAQQVYIASTRGDIFAIDARSTGHQIVVAGTVSGYQPIFFGWDSTVDSQVRVTIEKTGQVRSFEAQAIRADSMGEIVNHGLVSGDDVAIRLSQDFAGVSTVTNTGTIEAGTIGVMTFNNGGVTATTVITNSGTISGGQQAYLAYGSIDQITNSGKFVGDVLLEDSDDLYDGRLGTIQGDVLGGDGKDKLYAGAGNTKLFGQNGDDTLMGGAGADYLSGGTGTDRASYASATKAVVVSLANPAINSGDAKGDSYNSIENLTGSNYSDALNGNSAANAINGAAGNDTIKGYAGNDTLTGYSGADNFVFNTALNASTNVDTITDFNFSADTIQLDDAIFPFPMLGTLSSAFFRANTTGLAQDADDRIIYETDTGELYYDANGNASGGGILFAKLGIGLGITAADFVVI